MARPLSPTTVEDATPHHSPQHEQIGEDATSGLNEHSPLLSPDHDQPGLQDGQSMLASDDPGWSRSHSAREESKSTTYMVLLTVAAGGLQLAWAAELSGGSPYLLSLGLSKSLLALVWIAGPLSGTVVQPFVGIKSDQCTSRFGRRRPYMVGGAFATVVSLIALAWAREIVQAILGMFGAEHRSVQNTTIIFAVIMVYVLDFSINVIEAAIRAFVVDNAPAHQQDTANAWASRFSGIGSIVGYLSGYVDLPEYLWFFGDTQFKVLCIISSIGFVITVAISCLAIRETPLRQSQPLGKSHSGLLAFFRDLTRSVRRLPPQIRKICQVQFFAWVGWFPFLFYTTTYVAEIYAEPLFQENPNLTPDEIDAIWERGTRIGTLALFIFALTTFASSIFVPLIVAKAHEVTRSSSEDSTLANKSMAKTQLLRFGRMVQPRRIAWLTIRRLWFLSHIFFVVLMWLTLLVRDTTTATILIGAIGVPWAVTSWAPFALLALEIKKREAIRSGALQPPPTQDGELLAAGEDPSDGADQAGVVLGINNVAVSAPQAIATLGSSIVFYFLQKPRGSPGDDSIGWVLRLGGLATIFAARMTLLVEEPGDL